jgi:hypothetical protein
MFELTHRKILQVNPADRPRSSRLSGRLLADPSCWSRLNPISGRPRYAYESAGVKHWFHGENLYR